MWWGGEAFDGFPPLPMAFRLEARQKRSCAVWKASWLRPPLAIGFQRIGQIGEAAPRLA